MEGFDFKKLEPERERERERERGREREAEMGNGHCGLMRNERSSAFDSLKKRGGGEIDDENVDFSNKDASYVGKKLSKHSLCSNEYTDGHFGPVEWQKFHRKCTSASDECIAR